MGLVAAAFAGAVVLPAGGLGLGLGGSASALDAVHQTPATASTGMTGMTGMAGMPGMPGMHPAAATSCPAPSHSPVLSEFTQQLPVPPRVDAQGGGTTALTMRGGTHRFHAGLAATPAFGYTASSDTGTDVYGGPTIEARKGVPVHARRHERAGRPPARPVPRPDLHGHDRHRTTSPRAGSSTCTAPTASPPRTASRTRRPAPARHCATRTPTTRTARGLWYHDHSWGMTRLQVSAGLAGQYWLRDAYDTGKAGNPLGLP